jgi:hypothetical protein
MSKEEEIKNILLEFGGYEVSFTDKTINKMAKEILRLRRKTAKKGTRPSSSSRPAKP